MFNCKLPFDAICKLNAKLQTEQAGRAGEAYTHTPCHSNPRWPIPESPFALCTFRGSLCRNSFFLPVTVIRIDSKIIYIYIYTHLCTSIPLAGLVSRARLWAQIIDCHVGSSLPGLLKPFPSWVMRGVGFCGCYFLLQVVAKYNDHSNHVWPVCTEEDTSIWKHASMHAKKTT